MVSVIIPVFDRANFLADAIESLKAQDFEPLEIIVVDDGSTDGSADIAESFDGVRVIRREHHGVSATRNAGIAAARGKFVSFLDSDDMAMPDMTSIQIGYLREHPETDCVLGRMEMFFEPGFESPFWIQQDLLYGALGGIPPTALMTRRRSFDIVGGYDETMHTTEDRDWLFRAKAAGLRIDVSEDLFIRRRIHGTNLTYKVEEMRGTLFQSLHGLVKATRSKGQ